MCKLPLDAHIDWPTTGLATCLLLPPMFLARQTANPLWLQSALVTICCFIATERGKLTPFGSLIQGFAINAGWLVLWLALPHRGLFATAITLFAAVSLRLVGTGERSRAIGSFTAVPAIYLCFHLAKDHEGLRNPATVLRALPILLAGALPIWLWRVWQCRDWPMAAMGLRLELPDAAARDDVDPQFRWTWLVGSLGVGFCAWVALRLPVPNAQWLVWSALVVVCGDPVATSRKFRDRSVGVLAGAPCGWLAATLLPRSSALSELTMFAALLTLVAIKRYALAYGIRSALIVLFVTLGSADPRVPLMRVVDVVVGSAVGWGCSLLSRKMTRY